MAGLGRRTFVPGEVLTATNVMGYLQDQAVMNFAGTAARGSAIGTAVAEGMVSYLADTNFLQIYDGNAWRSVNGVQRVMSQAERDSLLPAPNQGDKVFRWDLGVEETYYGLYNASTNTGGRTTAGWYANPPAGLAGQPWKMATGFISNSNTGAGNSSGWYYTTAVTVTFPSGRFSATPIVHAGLVSGVVSTTYITASSSTSFSFGVARLGDYAGGLPVNWTATQMTPTTGDG